MIKMLVMDVDGTLTDGKIYISSNGECFKAFNIKDGYGIHSILPLHGIIPVIITGRTSAIVERRAAELGITQLYQGVMNKYECLHQLAENNSVSLSEIACIGDDVIDIPMMKMCALSGCPADAAAEVIECCDHVCRSCGGQGAVREFIEWVLSQNDR